MRSVAYFLIFLFTLACTSKKKPDVQFLKQKISASQKIKLLFDEENAELLNLNPTEFIILKEIYEQRKFKPFWLVKERYNEAGEILLHEFKQLISYGLPQKRYRNIDLAEKFVVKNEIKLTSQLIQLHHDLKYGFFIDSIKKNKPLSYSYSLDFLRDISFSKPHDSIHLQIIKFGKSDTIYQKLALSLYHFTKNNPLNDTNYKIPSYKKDTLKCLTLTKRALRSKNYLSTVEIDSLTLSETLKIFQRDNGLEPDGKIGKQTIDALNETNLHKCQRAALALEKLRWKTNDYSRLISINIPEFMLRLYIEDTLKSVHRIIVGKEDKQTPELTSKVFRIITYPYWSVPFSITSEEFLPILKKNPNYLTKNNLRIYRKDEEIDPLTVDWKRIKNKTFPFKVIQDYGRDNSLGIIKFEFQNKYGVYVHDTPTKRLFKTAVRSYSHGCMRCENPDSLAKIILRKDKNLFPADSLDSLLMREKHMIISLKNRILIQVEYISVVVNEGNKLIFLRDIYRRDEKYLKEMF